MKLSFLRSVPFLAELSQQDLDAFGALLTFQDLPAKQQLVAEGEPIHALFLVAQGVVHVRRFARKREVLLGRIGAGGFFGEINLFDPGTATASVYAMTDVTVGRIGYETMRTYMAQNPTAGYQIASALLREVSHRLRLTNERFVNAVYWAGATPFGGAEKK
jgi:CRP/FNR family transcriptional regulator, cyclic AMP receptor protein